jgi:hypothetical protein
MSGKFAIFSTELGASLTPSELSGVETLVQFDRDPIVDGEYNPSAGASVRGSVIATLGGVVVQDFGASPKDGRIEMSDEAALSETTVDAIQVLYEAVGEQYYFTDGYDCWLVYFSKPDGYTYKRNLVSSHFGVPRFDYSIKFVMISKDL